MILKILKIKEKLLEIKTFSADSMLNILFLTGQLASGGQERQFFYLVKSLLEKGHKPSVYVWNFRENDYYVNALKALNIPVYHPIAGAKLIGKINHFISTANKNKPDFIQSFAFYHNFTAWMAGIFSGAKTAGSIRSSYSFIISQQKIKKIQANLCLRLPRVHISNNYSAKEEMRSLNLTFRPEIRIVPNGIEADIFAPKVKDNTAQTLILVGTGRLFYIKRWDIFAEIIAGLRNKGLQVTGEIAGDGVLKESLLQKASDFNISEYLHFKGLIADIPTFLNSGHIFVHTSDSEGTSNSIMEAMSCGLPVVVTDVGDARYLVRDGIDGYIVQPGNADFFIDKIVYLMQNPQKRIEMGKNARQRIEEHFSVQVMAEKYLSIYHSLIKKI
jgi:glycosyltransferase involved in cell wall biosynthesis